MRLPRVPRLYLLLVTSPWAAAAWSFPLRVALGGSLLARLAASWSLPYQTENPDGWTLSLMAGRSGVNGTELLYLVGHKGSLYGGNGYWMHPSNPACQVFRLDSPTGTWVLDGRPSPYAGRIEFLKSVTWTTDSAGQGIQDNRLIAGYYVNFQGTAQLMVAGRDDSSGSWREEIYYQGAWRNNYYSTRVGIMHRDSVTNTDMLFFTCGMPGIIRAVYNAARASGGSFDPSPESGAFPTRPLSLTVCNGVLYTAGGSFIRRRHDGTQASWSTVFDMAPYEPGTVDESVGGVRGLSTIPNPSGVGESLYFSWCPNANSKGCMIRVDVSGSTYTHTQESCVPENAVQIMGAGTQIGFTIANYNEVLAVPTSGGLIHLVGYEILLYGNSLNEHPISDQVGQSGGFSTAYYAGAGYLIRRGPTSYEARLPGGTRQCFFDRDPIFVATRTLCNSPFASDDAIYMGGYDANFFTTFNKAWAVRGTTAAVHSEPVVYGGRPCIYTTTTTTTTTPWCYICQNWFRQQNGVAIVDWSRTQQPIDVARVHDDNDNTWGGGLDYVADLGRLYYVASISAIYRQCTCSAPGSLLLRYSADASASSWVTFATPTMDLSGGRLAITHAGGFSARYLKWELTAQAPTQQIGLWEVRLQGYRDSPVRALNPSKIAGTDQSGNDYTCQHAQDWVKVSYECGGARTWWEDDCCEVVPPTPAPPPTPPPPPPTPPPVPGSVPAPAPVAAVTISVTLAGLDYALLTGNPSLRDRVVVAAKRAALAQINTGRSASDLIAEGDVTVNVLPGSVRLEVVVAAPAQRAGSLLASLQGTQTQLGSGVLGSVQAVSGIGAAATGGSISLAGVSVASTPTGSPTPTAPASTPTGSPTPTAPVPSARPPWPQGEVLVSRAVGTVSGSVTRHPAVLLLALASLLSRCWAARA